MTEGNKMADNEIIFAPRFEIVEKSFKNGSSADGYRTEYDYEKVLEKVSRLEDDIYKYKGKTCAEGRFQGYPDGNRDLFLFEDGIFNQGNKIIARDKYGSSASYFYVADNVLVKYEMLFDYPKQAYTYQKSSLYDLQGNAISDVMDGRFIGFDKEQHLLAIQTEDDVKVFKYDEKGIHPYQITEPSLARFSYFTDVPSFRGEIVEENGEAHLKQTETFVHNGVSSHCLFDENGRGHLYYEGDLEEEKISFDKINQQVLPHISRYLELFDKEFLEAVYAAQVQAAIGDNLDALRRGYQELYGQNIDDIRGYYGMMSRQRDEPETLYQYYAERLPESKNAAVLQKCFLDRYLQDTNVPAYKGLLGEAASCLDNNMQPSSLENEEKLKIYCHYLQQHPQDITEKFIGKENAFYYMGQHPEVLANINLKKIKRSRSNENRDAPDVLMLNKVNNYLWSKGVNILELEDFALATDDKQLALIQTQEFKISQQEDFNYAFFALARNLRNPQEKNAATAKNLLKKLCSENRQFADLGTISVFNRSMDDDLYRAAGVLLDVGELQLKDIPNVDKLESCADAQTLKSLYAKNILKLQVTDYLKKPLDELCPVNDKFSNPSEGEGKTNLLDYFLQKGDSQKVAWLLNHGANVNNDVDRYSRKQKKLFPIKPFARYIDNKIFLRREHEAEQMLSKIAEGLDANKKQVINQIFASLPYKSREQEAVKSLQTKMLAAFVDKQNEAQRCQEEQRRYEAEKAERERQRAEVEARRKLLQQELLQKLEQKEKPEDKSLQERIDDIGYNLSFGEEKVFLRKTEDESSYYKFELDNNAVFEINRQVTKIEGDILYEKQREEERQQQQRRIDEAKAHGCPSNLEIPSHQGMQHGFNGWVIEADGNSRQCDRWGQKTAIWDQIFADEVVLQWKLDYIGEPHQFDVLYKPAQGLTEAQKQKVLEVENDIHETWQEAAESRGKVTPGIGLGWNLSDRQDPLLNDLEKNSVKVKEEEVLQESAPTISAEENRRLLKEAKQKLKDKTLPKDESVPDFSKLSQAFGGLANVKKGRSKVR